jgi:general secretion pathway protein A
VYTSFFGLREKPFELTPDPRFLFLGRQHKEALSRMIYGVRNRKGLIVLTGEVGTGKTTLVRALLEQLRSDVQVAYLFNTQVSAIDFYRLLFRDLGLALSDQDKTYYQQELQSFLEKSHRDQKTTILIVDEAHYLDEGLLGEIRVMANLETTRAKLLQMLLVGQPELNEHLDRPQWRQLRQRITVRYHLDPLNRDETHRYILTRIRIAGGEQDEVFTWRAIQRIYEYSRGVPRLINNICDNALLTAYARERSTVDDKIIRECVRELDIGGARRRPRRKPVGLKGKRSRRSSILVIVVLLVIGFLAVGYGLLKSNRLTISEEIIPIQQGNVEERVEQFFLDYESRYEDRDLAGFLSFFSSRAIQNGTQGLDEIERVYSDLFAESQDLRLHMNSPWITFGDEEVEVIAQCEIERTTRSEGEDVVWVGTIRWVLSTEKGEFKIHAIDYEQEPPATSS